MDTPDEICYHGFKYVKRVTLRASGEEKITYHCDHPDLPIKRHYAPEDRRAVDGHISILKSFDAGSLYQQRLLESPFASCSNAGDGLTRRGSVAEPDLPEAEQVDDNKQRYTRQEGIIPHEKLREAVVIGVGAIGRQVATILTTMGVPKILLIDFDKVEIENCAAQGYKHTEMGRYKVEALTGELIRTNPHVKVDVQADRFRQGRDGMGENKVYFVCVDSMTIRKLIWKSVKDDFEFLCDGRMLGEALRYLTVLADDKYSIEHYSDPENLYPSEEAAQGTCTTKTTFYSAYVIAGKMVQQYSRWIRRLPCDYDVIENLLTNEIIVRGTAYDKARRERNEEEDMATTSH